MNRVTSDLQSGWIVHPETAEGQRIINTANQNDALAIFLGKDIQNGIPHFFHTLSNESSGSYSINFAYSLLPLQIKKSNYSGRLIIVDMISRRIFTNDEIIHHSANSILPNGFAMADLMDIEAFNNDEALNELIKTILAPVASDIQQQNLSQQSSHWCTVS